MSLPKEWIQLLYETFRKECKAEGIHNAESYPKNIHTIVRTVEGKIVASAHIERFDMHDRLNYTPWITSLLVHPNHRGEGHAKSIVNEAKARYPLLYAYCAEEVVHNSIYDGFSVVERRIYLDRPVVVMRWINELKFTI